MQQFFPNWFRLVVVLAGLGAAACEKSEDRHIWDNYHTNAEDGYVDNDAYYIPPTGYDNSSILDPD